MGFFARGRSTLRRLVITSFFFGLTVILAGLFAVAYASSNNTANTTGKTAKTTTVDSASCGQCHTKNTNVTATFSGPDNLYPGDYGNYRVTITKTTDTGSPTLGIDVAATETTALTVTGGEPTAVVNGEVTHTGGTGVLRHLNTATNYYSFRYTMPAAAAAASTHTMYSAVAVGPYPGGGWNFGTNKTITTKALPTAPATLTAGTPTASSVPLNWTAAGPQYRVVAKTGTFATTATDGSATIVYEGSGTAATATGLTTSTAYFFSAFSKDVGVDSGASFFSTTGAQATATTGSALDPNPWVDAATGNDANAGTSAAPFKTIKQALTAVGPGGTIHVRPGTYNTSLGETFPITVPSGIKLVSSAGAVSTIISAAGANTRVIELNGNSIATLVEGFTITGGLFTQPANGGNAKGGGIYAYNNDQTTISRSIITGNELRGYNGDGVSYVSGGIAYGGGIHGESGTTRIINSVISNNTARGGNGSTRTSNGGSGGNGHGGGIWAFSTMTLTNNTFFGNQSIGGNGGSSTGSGFGGDGGTALYAAADVYNGTVNNNIFANNSAVGGSAGTGSSGPGSPGGAVSGGLNSQTASNNLFFNNTGGNGSTGTNPVIGDPLFVSAPSDLHVRTASPAKAAGLASGAPTLDLDGNTRATPPTIGAYEMTLFLVATPGIGRITLTWQPVDGASSYNLYYATSSGVNTSSTKITNVTSPYGFEPLPNGSLYYFVLTAVENGIEGPISPEASALVPNGTWAKGALPFGASNFTNVTRDLASGTTLYVTANDSVGLYKSTDSGNTWIALPGPYSGTAMRAVAANGSNVLVAGKGSVYRSTNGGTAWTTSFTGAGIGEDFIAAIAIDPLAPNIVYAADFHLNGGSTASDLIAKSTDSGASFTNIIDASSSNLRGYFLQINPSVSGTLYAAGSGTPNIGKSINNGSQWTSVSPASGYPTALAIAPSSTSTLFAGMRDTSNSNSIGVYKTVNGGTNWNPFNTGLPVTLPDIQSLLVDSANANKVYAGTSQGYYITTDGGSNWSSGPSGAGSGLNALAQTSTRRLVGTAVSGIYLLTLDPAPTVNANASPGSGTTAGGTSVFVTGTGFNPTTGLRVLFGGIDGSVNLGASSTSSISVTTPAHAGGNVDVIVVNPDGQAGLRSNGYTYTCPNATLSPTSATFSSSSGTGSVTVTIGNGCAWTATAPGGSFVTITNPGPGTGSGTVNYSFASNSGALRNTTLTIAGQSFVVTQNAAGTSMTLSAAASSAQVALSWTTASGATSYQVRRSDNGGAFNTIMTTSSLSFNDTTVSNGSGYLYQILAINGGTIGASNIDLAVPFGYTRPTLSVGGIIFAIDWAETRQVVNAGRVAAGLAAMTFTDTSLSGGVKTKRIHLIEIRTGVDEARAAIGMTPLAYTDSTITVGATKVKAAHINEPRTGMK